MNNKIEILCLVLLGVGLLLVASIVVKSYLANKQSTSTAKQPNYPSAVYAKYKFSRSGSRVKVPVVLKISLQDGIPKVMYIKSLAGKSSKLLKVTIMATTNKNNYVAHDAKGRSYGFHWNQETSRIAHSFSYVTKKGQAYFGVFQESITAQRWRKLIGIANKRKK